MTLKIFWRVIYIILLKMVKLLVNYISRLLFRLYLLWVALLTRRGSYRGFTSIIGVLGLLSWLNKLNKYL